MKKLVLVATAAALLSPSATAQTAFEGFHAGLYGGYTPIGNDNNSTQAGVLAGYRLSPAENLILGVEAQGGLGSLNGSNSMLEGFLLTHAGVAISNTLLFASAGVGHRSYQDGDAFFPAPNADSFYSLGAGVEFAANDLIHLRVEAHKLIGMSDDGYVGDAEAVRANFGVIAQFN